MMGKFRAKPVLVDAVQFTGKNYPAVEDLFGDDLELKVGESGIQFIQMPDVSEMHAGDWLIRDSEKWDVLTDAGFQRRFESVPEIVIPWTETGESSNIAGYSYDGPSMTLTIGFSTGGRYVYRGVDLKTVEGFQKAQSKGAYFYAHIKDSHKWSKLTEVKDA